LLLFGVYRKEKEKEFLQFNSSSGATRKSESSKGGGGVFRNGKKSQKNFYFLPKSEKI
jgi:hypothetical protein